MKHKKVWLSCLSLSLLACSPQTALNNSPQPQSTPAATPVASATAPTQTLSYAEALRAGFSQQQRKQASQQVALFQEPQLMQHAGIGLALSGSTPLSSAPMMEGSSEAPPELSSTEEAALLQLFKNLFQGQAESLQALHHNLQALTSPSDFATEHQQILDYLALQQQLSQDLLNDLKQQGLKLLQGDVPERYREKMLRLHTLRSLAQQALASLEIESIQQRLSPAETEALSPEAWLERLNTLIEDPGRLSYGPTALTLLGQPGDSAQKQTYLEHVQLRWPEQLAALKAIRPPASKARAHAALIGFLELDLEVLNGLPFEALIAEPDPQMSLASLASLSAIYSRPELVEKLFWQAALFSEVRELLQTLGYG